MTAQSIYVCTYVWMDVLICMVCVDYFVHKSSYVCMCIFCAWYACVCADDARAIILL